MSKPPEPRPSSTASTLTTISSPGWRGADEADVGDRGAPLVADVDRQPLLGRVGRTGDEDGRAPQSEHASSSAYVTSSMPSSAATLTRSSGWWLRSVPLARFVQ